MEFAINRPTKTDDSYSHTMRAGVFFCPEGRRFMHEVWGIAALWLGLALVATLISIWLKIATALSEIIVGTVAQL